MNKKIWIPIISALGAVVVATIVLISLTFTVWKVDLKINATQDGKTSNISVVWETSKPVESVEIKVTHNGDEVSFVRLSNSQDVLKGSYNVSAFYGKHRVEVKVKNKLYTTTKVKTVKVFADEYNIAPITATMPVTIFSLSLMDGDNGIGVNAQGEKIPTFVWFKRSEAWDYSKMPENVYTIPTVSAGKIKSNANQREIYSETTKWVKELYEINPSSKFNFYYNDYYAYGWMQTAIGLDLPTENYKVVLLSDGTASFSYFNEHFDNANYQTEYAKMLNDYQTLKTQIKNKGTYKEDKGGYAISAGDVREYAYLMAKEESNVEWWLTRVSGTLAPNTPEVYSEVEALVNEGKIKVKDLNTLLKALEEEEKVELKALYNFSDTMFEKAANEDKKIMVILGTWTDTEKSTNFDDYVKAVQKYYGDNYVYYYKGHPKNPTNSVAGKLEHLADLGLIDVDSTIPAELIFFFNPDAYCTGYQSSTFVSLDDEHSCGIFDVKKDAFSESYKSNIDFFVTKLDNNDAVFGGLVDNDSSFLLEFVDVTNYDIAIYNKANNTIVYYKKTGEVYEPVNG